MSRKGLRSGWNLLDAVSAATGSTIDNLYASAVHRLGIAQPFFKQGWGDLSVVDFNEDAKHFQSWPPEHFDLQVDWKKLRAGRQSSSGLQWELLEGTFRTPCYGRVYDALPEESRTARVQLLRPEREDQQRACVLHLAATGEHSFRSRLRLGEPLLAQGTSTLVLESPFYGARMPKVQTGSRLQRVSDLLTLGRATIEEGLFLLHGTAQRGIKRLGVAGFSMGGVHASMVASLYPHALACTPLLAPRSAAVAYCKGALWDATAWKPLASATDAKHQDVLEKVMRAAQPNLVTAAALRVLQQPHLHSLPPEPTGHPDSRGSRSTEEARSRDQAASSDTGSEVSTDGRGLGPAGAKPWLWLRRGGIDAAERLWRDMLRDVRRTSDLEYQHARLRLEQVLETYTDITRFPPPKQPRAAVIVGAKGDRYVDPQSILETHEHWPGSEVRWVEGGHVTAFVLCQSAFRAAISDALDRLDLSHPTESLQPV